jgi:hypothetical protein
MRCDFCGKKVMIVYKTEGIELCKQCLQKEEGYKKDFEKQVEAPALSAHHITPSSRKGNGCKTNIAYVNECLHEKYHALFMNRVPDEILDFLVNYFWGGRLELIRTYLERREKNG